ncbi:hypothetical protein KVR01_012242 [Diaporthe batatas]|uniref:uncharacterized protein n=1 Tax=Diaporthe batatas TaxID=748121 RepID=UPI001D05BA47|nr:uncharacterized protein KVR01_012242 [Diaporthe batatas]KAG8157970.1 hypothetical protein KVR01_012242 [Diaporthe batatas]
MASPVLSIWLQISVKSPSGIESSFATCPEGENAPAWEPWQQEQAGTRSPAASSELPTVQESSSLSSSSSPTSTPTPVCEAGVEYAVYFFPDGSDECQELIKTSFTQDPLNLNLAKILDGKVPQATGITPNIYGLELNPQSGEPTTIYDYTTPSDVDISSSCTVVYHRGYLVLSNPDNSHPLSIYDDVDDLIYIWGGDAALSGGFDPSNTIIRKVMGTWNNEQIYHQFGVEDSTKLKRDVTSYIPIRLFYANLPGAGQFQLLMNDPPTHQFIILCTPGLEYAIYTYSTTSPEYDELDNVVRYSALFLLDLRILLQNKVPQDTGNTESVEWSSNDETSPIAIYGYSADSGTSLSNTCLVIQHRGFVKFHSPGTYTFEIVGDPDTLIFAWLGPSAFSGNFDTRQSYLAKLYQSNDVDWTTFEVVVSDTDELIPIRVLYANLIGPGAFKVSFSGPAGTPPPSLVQCSGIRDTPDWLPWDQEEVPELIPYGRT